MSRRTPSGTRRYGEPRSARAVQSNPAAATILVVDDEPMARETLTDLLEAHGYEVREASTAEEAFDRLHEADLILLDAMLPGTDGWTVCREIKERIDPHLPIIMVTARTAPEDVVRTFDAGADDYVPKPFQVAELRARIDSRLRAHRAEQALQRANEQASTLAEQNYRLYEQARADAEHREALLRELDHRVRNNLSVIMGLISLERSDESGSAEQSLLRLENRLRAFLLAYEAFRRSSYKGVPFTDIMQRVLQRLRNSLRPRAPIAITVSGDDDLIPERLGFALALAVNELGTAALRHGFPDGRGGQLAASVVLKDDTIELTMADDGLEREPEADAGTTSSDERSVLRTLVETELGGRVTYDPTAQGNRVRISCPLDGDDPRQ